MKKQLLLVLAGIILFLFILFTSFGWYKIFYKPLEGNAKITNLQVTLEDNNNNIHETDALPTTNQEEITPYQFSIKNNSSTAGVYKVLIEDSITTDINKTLSRKQLAYELKLNGTIIQTGILSEIENNILDKRSIEGNKENKYELKVWISDKAMSTDWQNKSYSYKINIQTEG